ncbi:MAG: CidA/LrgA family protein [Butyricicoccus sp.]|nr:CidA/LrgA family protein [Butyricicoccus sp.]MBQ8584813.1 CidA/LrgA family protein [Butyricicoccus sp.]
MYLLFQFTIILGVSCAGEALAALIPLPIPAGIYGLLLMLLGLVTKIIPLDRVKTAGDFLIAIMPVCFIAPAAALLLHTDALLGLLLPLFLACIVSTAVVMAVTGRLAQFLIRRKGDRK